MPESPSFEYAPISNLRFDPDNPRFPTSMDGTDTDIVLRFMLQDAGLIDLMRSIAKQGFFPGEPLLVCPGAPGTQDLIVVEGNRRLAACILLESPQLAPINQLAVREVASGADLSQILPVPCLRFATRGDILKHLGYRHVTGIKEWEPLAKARFLDQQFQMESGPVDEQLKSVARSIGSRSDYVGRLLTAYRLYQTLEQNEFFEIDQLTETSINFSLITSVLAYSKIVTYLGLTSSKDLEMSSLSQENWGFLAKFIYEADEDGDTRLGESRNIRVLADIVANARARDALENGASLNQAKQLLNESAGAYRGLISQASQCLELAGLEMDGVRYTPDDLTALEHISEKALSLRAAMQSRIDGAE